MSKWLNPRVKPPSPKIRKRYVVLYHVAQRDTLHTQQQHVIAAELKKRVLEGAPRDVFLESQVIKVKRSSSRALQNYCTAPPTSITVRLLSCCTGRLFLPSSALSAATSSPSIDTGFLRTTHVTPSVHGGVVSEPPYVK